MAERSCRPAFSLPFHSLIIARQVDFSDEVPDQFNLLPAVTAGLIRRMNDNFLYKLIDDGGRQFLNTHILTDNCGEAVKVCLVLLVGVNGGLFCLDKCSQLFLLRFILRRQLQKPFVGNRTRYIVWCGIKKVDSLFSRIS